MIRPTVPAILALALVLTGLLGRFAVHLLQLARKGDHRDFAAVYTAAHVFRAGASFYDPKPDREHFGPNQNPILVEAARRLGTLHAHDALVHIHEFSYPPFTLLAFVPFTALRFHPAAVLWQGMSLGFLAIAGWCLWRAARLSPTAGLTLAAMALVFEPLENSLGLGQINLLILALTCIFLAALQADRPAIGGIALGLAAALRIHPALFLLYLAWRGEWRACLWAAGTAAACTLAAIPLVGWSATLTYGTLVAPKYGRALFGQGNHSLTGWLMKTGHGLVPRVPVSLWRFFGQMGSLGLLALAFAALRPPGRTARGRLVPEVAFLSTVLLLATPNTTINHLVFTLIPLAVLLERGLGTPPRPFVLPWLGAAVVLIGAIDDYYGHPSLAAGPGVLLSGIKTYGLVILVWLCFKALRRRPTEAVA